METTEEKDGQCCNWNFDELRQRTEDYVRDEPTKAVGIALAIGVFLTVVPVFRIVGVLLRLVLALARPALMIFGGLKAYEEITKRYGE